VTLIDGTLKMTDVKIQGMKVTDEMTEHETQKLSDAIVTFSTVVNDLGVKLDSQLTMANHIAVLSRSCFFYMRQLRSIKQALTPDATRKLIDAFI